MIMVPGEIYVKWSGVATVKISISHLSFALKCVIIYNETRGSGR